MRIFNLLVLCCLGSASSLLLAEEQILESVVRIYAVSPEKRIATRGTGIVIQGGVLTAAHVVEGYSDIEIHTGDGDNSITYDGEVIFKDTLKDLCFLRVKGIGDRPVALKPVQFNTDFPVSPGSPIYAIGNSLGFTRTVSAGIVSASGTRRGEKFLFVDALTRKGNSGGPVVNRNGEVIGLVLGTLDTAVVGQARIKDPAPEFTQAVPSADIVEFLQSKGNLGLGYLGAGGRTVKTGFNSEVASEGLEITKITRDSGLRVGDVLTALGDDSIVSQRDLFRSVRKLQPGAMAKGFVLRNGSFVVLDLRIGSKPL